MQQLRSLSIIPKVEEPHHKCKELFHHWESSSFI